MTTDQKIEILKQQFLQGAYVKDAAQGYVVAKEFNLTIDPQLLTIASQCWAEQFRNTHNIDAIVGLPDAGARLVPVVGTMLHIPHILPSKRALVVPGAWENVVSFSNASFTTGQQAVSSHIGFDDVIAHGTTAIAAIQALQAAGAEVAGMQVLFEKVWQGGAKKIQAETGITPFSLIRIQEIQHDGKIVLA
jgi:xanthine phosphoribosyltransferase